MSTLISAGKLRKLQTLSDAEGRFRMMAIDQRGSVADSLANRIGVEGKDLPFDALARTKEVITRVLAPHATAVLTDPIYGYPGSVQSIPGDTAVLLACEETGYEKAGEGGKERRSLLIPGWSVSKTKNVGADAVKILLYSNPYASEETQTHQQDLVRGVGQECAEHDLPFLLEIVSYSLKNASGTVEYAKEKPEIVIENAREYAKPEYGVDILKLEFPCDLKFTEEYARGLFGGKRNEAAYTLDEVREHCKKLDEACAIPWVILSAGVGIDEFVENVKLCVEAGASGYLCGRAVWKGALDFYPNMEAMEEYCRTVAVYNWARCSATAEKALPWFDHRHYGGRANLVVEGLTPDWYHHQHAEDGY